MKKIKLMLLTLASLGCLSSCGSNDSSSSSKGKFEETIIFDMENPYFGTYPQKQVKGADLLRSLNKKTGALPTPGKEKDGEWVSYNYYINNSLTHYMWYIDVEHEDGNKYRGVYFTSYRPCYTSNASIEDNTYQVDNGYTPGKVYWFKYEPILWDVLESDDKEAFVMSNMILDSQDFYHKAAGETRDIKGTDPVTAEAYDVKGINDNNYKYSNLRSFANKTFYDLAFKDNEKSSILTTKVDNSKETTGYSTNYYVSEDTMDKFFPLSVAEMTNPKYKFNEHMTTYDPMRRKRATDYAKCMGVVVYYAEDSDYNDLSVFWLRSPEGLNPNYAADTYYVGAIYAYATNFTSLGFLPGAHFSI